MIIQISILVVILLIFIYLIYWYKYKCIDQIDKIIKNPFRQLLALSACVLLIFGLLIITGKSLVENSDASRALVLLYSLFSQTTSAYNPEYGTELQLFSVLVSMLGAVFFFLCPPLWLCNFKLLYTKCPRGNFVPVKYDNRVSLFVDIKRRLLGNGKRCIFKIVLRAVWQRIVLHLAHNALFADLGKIFAQYIL